DRRLCRRRVAPPRGRGSRIAMLYSLARPLLFALDPETAHNAALKFSRICRLFAHQPPPCPVRVMGLDFPNPVGLAAGLDKHAEHVDAMAALGFGFLGLRGGSPA